MSQPIRFWRVAIVVFAAMVLINFMPIFSGSVPFPRDLVVRHSAWNGEPREQLPELIDVVAQFYPFRALIGAAGRERTIPLWNPYIMGGAPFQADGQSAVLYPINILYYALPLKIAWTASTVLRLFLAAVFMTLFVRSIGASATGSIVSGILFSLCGYTVQWQGMAGGESGIWLPLMCYAVHRLHLKPNRSSIAIAAIVFPMPLLAGHPETAAHSAAVAVAFAIFLWAFPNKNETRRFQSSFALKFVLAGLLALGVASVQLLPTVEWLQQLGLQVSAPEPVLDRHQGQGLFSRDITKNPSSARLRIPEAATYIGMLGLLAASLAYLHPRRRYVYFFAGSAVIAAAVAFGVEPIRSVVVHLPIVKAMKNGRLTLVIDFALAAMAGLGITALTEEFAGWSSSVRRRAVAVLFVAALIVTGGIYEVHRATWVPVDFSRSPWASLLFLMGAFVLLGLRLKGLLDERVFSYAVCGFAAFEMLTFSYGYGGYARASEVYPPAPVFEFLRSRDSSMPFRVAKDRVPMPHDAGMFYGFETADGYDLSTERTRAFTADFSDDRADGVMFLGEKILAAHDRRFDMLNVKYLMVTQPGPQFDAISASNRFGLVFSRDRVAVFENKMSFPRFFLVPLSGIEVVGDATTQLARLKEPAFDPQRSVIFSEQPRALAATPAAGNARETQIAVVDRRINSYRLRVETTEPAVLVVSQMFYPGWKATVDGRANEVYPVDLALTGLMIPSGAHDVRLFFAPLSFRIGLSMTVVSLLVVCVLLIPTSRRKAD